MKRRASEKSCAENQECYMGGSAEAEAAQFQQFAQMTREIMERQAKEHSDGKIMRAVHAKDHACFTGELKVYDSTQDSDSRTRYGVFTEPGKGVAGPNETQTQDFIMINSTWVPDDPPLQGWAIIGWILAGTSSYPSTATLTLSN